MDFLRNVSVSGEYHQPEQVLSSPCSKLGASIDDLFPTQNTEVDVSLEWLSIFVEDCLSSTGNCIPVAATAAPNVTTTATTTTKPTNSAKKPHQITPPSLQKFVVPGKARSKRKRVSTTLSKTKNNPFCSWYQSLQLPNSDPLLLQQSCWLADSELIMPKKEDDSSSGMVGYSEVEESTKKDGMEEEKAAAAAASKESIGDGNNNGVNQQQPRRCSHCLAQRTPQWRAGPLGPKTLCNACGVRYKSGGCCQSIGQQKALLL